MNTTEIGREAVLKALQERAPRSMHLMEVVGALELPKTRKSDVLDVLEELKELGMAREMPGHRFRLNDRPPPRPRKLAPAPEKQGCDVISGWLTKHPRGFAFVAAEDGGPDVFVPGLAIG